uniref:Thioesterase superfamily protein n=1 Tax=Cyanothece sp. (strain PCC 7425 / ATCC 29141) TaxID=395961 RepID=B8HT77_CYAP4
MAYEFKLYRQVEFAETDMAGVMHFSHFFRYMEATEHAFLRSLGLSVFPAPPAPLILWPRVQAECNFLAPLRFEDQVEIHLRVREKTEKRLTYGFRFRRVDQGQEVAQGILKVVCATVDDQQQLYSIAIPTAIASQIELAPD